MILAVTPARGGSKGVPRKNIRPLCGKPLLAWTIEAVQSSQLIDEYVVSTEDAEIAEVAEKWGARVLWRPPELATDEAETLPVLQHALQQVAADILVMLQATSPIRDEGLIDSCIQKFLDTGVDSLATGFNCTYLEYGKYHPRRQDTTGFFYDDGNVYVMRANLTLAGDQYGENIERVHLDREQNVEIDDEFDFWLTEQIMSRRLANQKPS